MINSYYIENILDTALNVRKYITKTINCLKFVSTKTVLSEFQQIYISFLNLERKQQLSFCDFIGRNYPRILGLHRNKWFSYSQPSSEEVILVLSAFVGRNDPRILGLHRKKRSSHSRPSSDKVMIEFSAFIVRTDPRILGLHRKKWSSHSRPS